MVCFFAGTNSYCLSQEAHTVHFSSSFYNTMIIIIDSILAVTIKNLSMSLNNKELAAIKKSMILFETVSYKKATNT